MRVSLFMFCITITIILSFLLPGIMQQRLEGGCDARRGLWCAESGFAMCWGANSYESLVVAWYNSRVRKHKSDKIIAVLVMLLMAIGLIVIYAIGSMRANFINSAYGANYDENYFFIHQVISVVLSMIVLIVMYKVPYQITRKLAKWILLAGLVACAVLAVLSVVHSSLALCQLGGCRWYNLGGLGSFQPAELVKLGLVLYLAQLMAERKKEGKLGRGKEFWVPFMLACGLSLFFVVILQKDMGTGVVMISIILAMLWMSGIAFSKFMLVLAAIAAVGVLAVVSSPHRMERLMTFGGDESADTYHIDNAMLAIGTGGLAGVGIGNSVQATGYLPESINDSVFAVMGETFGFLGVMLVVGSFLIVMLRMLHVGVRLMDMEQSLVVVGVFAWVAAHVVVNVAAMTGLIPLTGITLPFLSYGGTSMMFIAGGVGIVLQLSCYTGREVMEYKTVVSGRGVR